MDEQRLAEMITVARAQAKKVASGRYSRSPIPGTCHEDLVQEVMINLIKYLRKSETGEGQTKIEDWLSYVSKATINQYFVLLSKAYCHREVALFDSTEESTEEDEAVISEWFRSRRVSPADRVIVREALARVWGRIWELPRIHFVAYVLTQRAGYLGDDVATLLLEAGLCSWSQLAAKMEVTEAELDKLLTSVKHRSVAEVGTMLGLSPATASNRRSEAEMYIKDQPQRRRKTPLSWDCRRARQLGLASRRDKNRRADGSLKRHDADA